MAHGKELAQLAGNSKGEWIKPKKDTEYGPAGYDNPDLPFPWSSSHHVLQKVLSAP